MTPNSSPEDRAAPTSSHDDPCRFEGCARQAMGPHVSSYCEEHDAATSAPPQKDTNRVGSSPEDRAALADELANLHPTRAMGKGAEAAIGFFVLDHWNEIIAALRAAPAVPRRPTLAMIEAGAYAWETGSAGDVWQAMWDAAPGASHG